MKRVHKIFSLTAAIVFAGCAAMGPMPVSLLSNFDSTQAKKLLEPGGNIVTGSALIRQNGGGVVTCAGLPVQLIPKTAYASERIKTIYGNTERGYSEIHRQFQFAPDHSDYLTLTKRALCDAQGHFTFGKVADGEFYVITGIVWDSGGVKQGGSLMQAIALHDGESREIVLSP